ncbi:unnamed protein product [Rhizopus microsporus]
MVLNWARFRQVLETAPERRLDSVMDNIEFLKDFMFQLSQELKQIPTAIECARRYPAIGSLLTLAFSSLPTLEKSVLWCIIRLRRLILVSQTDEFDTSDKDSLMAQVMDLIVSKGHQISAETMARFTDYCIALAHDKDCSIVIEQIIQHALSDEEPDSAHFHREIRLSERFIHHLCKESSDLRDHYHCWPDGLKIRLLLQVDDFLDMEILQLIESFTQSSQYIDPDALSEALLKKELVQLSSRSTCLSNKLALKLSEYVELFHDWRVSRLAQYLYPCLEIELYQQLNSAFSEGIYPAKVVRHVHNLLLDHIYSGPAQEIPQRRTMAWCLSTCFIQFLWHCIHDLVHFIHDKDAPWTRELDDTLNYINWIIYPSIDHRQHESQRDMQNWFQSRQGLNESQETWFPAILLNSHGAVAACFITAALFSDRVQMRQVKSMLSRIFTLSQHDGKHGDGSYGDGSYGDNSNRVNQTIDLGSVYLFLDCLHDMQHHAERYPASVMLPSSFIKELKEFVNSHFL